MILKKKSFAPWVKKLSGWEVFAPLEKEGLWIYELAVDLKEIPPGYANTVGAPKKIIFPQREILFRFNTDGEGNPGIRETLPEKKDRVLFGVRPCDGRAVTLTDIVFGGDISDPYYARRRESAVLVGLACNTPPLLQLLLPHRGGIAPFDGRSRRPDDGPRRPLRRRGFHRQGPGTRPARAGSSSSRRRTRSEKRPPPSMARRKRRSAAPSRRSTESPGSSRRCSTRPSGTRRPWRAYAAASAPSSAPPATASTSPTSSPPPRRRRG